VKTSSLYLEEKKTDTTATETDTNTIFSVFLFRRYFKDGLALMNVFKLPILPGNEVMKKLDAFTFIFASKSLLAAITHIP